MRHPPHIAVGLSALSIAGASGAAHAQTSPAPAGVRSPTEGELIIIGISAAAQEGFARQPVQPSAQPSTPPSEAVTERAPANPAVRTYPRQADGHGIKLGGYNVSRWAEDWRAMRDPAKRDDPLDRLKYLGLDDSGKMYLTLSGEVRLRSNLTTNPGLVDSEFRRENLLRMFAGADLHLGPVRFFGELAHGGLDGHNIGTPVANRRNQLFVQQAFGELSGDVGGYTLGVRYGRQEFTDGTAGLVSQKEDNTIRTSMSGVRGWVQAGQFRADIFDFKQIKLGLEGTGDDVSDDATRFSGITMGVVLANTKTRKIFLDPFVWRERNDSLRWGAVSGREVRNYYGARLWGSIDRLTLDWVFDHQDGDFRGRNISAWQAAAAQTYVINPKGWSPKIGIHFDYGSGGGSYGTGTIHVMKTPTAGMIPYSYQGALNITNLFQASPNITISPFKVLDLTTELQHSWRANSNDAVYRSAGTAYAGSQNIRGSHVGDAIRLQASWKVTSRLSVIGRYEYFMPGAILDHLGYTNSHYVATWASFRF
jgi:hypothetical protein